MLTLAFCQDSPRAREGRQQQFAPHMQHLRSVMHGIRLAAPLATADGASVGGDDRLVASVFVLESASLESASELMAADPYTRQEVWQCVSFFAVENEFGKWLSTPGQSSAPARLYAALSCESGADRLESLAETAFFGARLRLQRSLGNAALAPSWQLVFLFAANSLTEAQSMAARGGIQTPQVWAIPMTAGSWPTQTSP